ncbi:MAG TPA: hypothetical protein VHU44_08835 [Acidobacteriaceae bacterium]|nr:hypothetical protein [Acidobacteriaceae bacterium]
MGAMIKTVQQQILEQQQISETNGRFSCLFGSVTLRQRLPFILGSKRKMEALATGHQK